MLPVTSLSITSYPVTLAPMSLALPAPSLQHQDQASSSRQLWAYPNLGPAAPRALPAMGLWHCTVPVTAWPPRGLVPCPSGTSSAWAVLHILLEGLNVTHQKRTLLLLPGVSSALQDPACSHHAQAAMQSRQFHLRRAASFQEIMLSLKRGWHEYFSAAAWPRVPYHISGNSHYRGICAQGRQSCG